MHPGCRLLRAWPLAGGVSAETTALEILLPDGQRTKAVIHRHGEADLRQTPHVAADEFRLLHALKSAGLLVPAPLFFDETGRILSTPYVVVEHIEGKTEWEPFDAAPLAVRMAASLARIHGVDVTDPDLTFLPRQSQRLSAWFKNSLIEGLPAPDMLHAWETLKSVWPLARPESGVLLHGDYWPGNILWRDGEIVAVIDWEDAELGDPLGDVANSRLELVLAFGFEAMMRFTDHYRTLAQIDISRLPYWDLCAALQCAPRIAKWGLDKAAETKACEKLRQFVNNALEQIH